MTALAARPKVEWGPRVELDGVPDLFAGTGVEPYRPPVPGIDNLGITSTDTFMVPGRGEVTVDFKGYVRVARSKPTAPGWNQAEVFTNLIEMYMRGDHPEAGPILVTLNPDYLSAGALWTPPADMACDRPAKSCRMAVNALFHLTRMGLTVFNKEPITLTIEDVRKIPPAGNPGMGRIHEKLPLYDRAAPDGRPVADITALKFAMGTYLDEAELRRLRDDARAILGGA
jgi:hypothetical protein